MSSHDTYYVPAQSKWPIIATFGMLITVYGLAVWFNDLKAARPESHGPWIFFVGGLLLAYMLFGWFGAVIKESRAGLYSAQMDRSFRWGLCAEWHCRLALRWALASSARAMLWPASGHARL